MKNAALMTTISTALLLLLFVAAPAQAYQWDTGPLELNSEGQAVSSGNGLTQPWLQWGNDHTLVSGESVVLDRLSLQEHLSLRSGQKKLNRNVHFSYWELPLFTAVSLGDHRPTNFWFDWSGPGYANFRSSWLHFFHDTTRHCFNYERHGSLISLFFYEHTAFSFEPFFIPGGFIYAIGVLKESFKIATPLPGALFLFGSGLVGLVALRKTVRRQTIAEFRGS